VRGQKASRFGALPIGVLSKNPILSGSEVSRIISPPRVVTSITHRSLAGSVMFISLKWVIKDSTLFENALVAVV
jgi:hypothetical protein